MLSTWLVRIWSPTIAKGEVAMKLVLTAIAVVAALMVLSAPLAHADSLLRITVGGTTVSCDTSGGACATAGFTGAANSNNITFTGTVGGVSFGGGGITGVQLTGNQPGTPALAFVLDTKTSLVNTNGTAVTVTVDFATNGFTNPVGAGFLAASQTANWTTSAAGDQQAFQAWERNANDLIVPGGTATAISPNCVSGGGLAQACSSQTLNVAVPSVIAPFALTGREVIGMSSGSTASYTATSTLTATPVGVPEPGSLLLLGSGLTMLAGLQWRKRRK